MCLLAIVYRAIDDAPVILAANREEAYARGGTPLGLQSGPIPFIAGLDPLAGGTWLGINAARVIVAVTNRPKSEVPPQVRSRGLLVRDLLALSSARKAANAAADALAHQSYAGCNIVCADAESLWVVHAGDWLRMRSLSPGFHLLTNGDVNDPTDERIAWVMDQLHEADPRSANEALLTLRQLASHAGPPCPICVRGSDRGTMASTLHSLGHKKRHGRLLHANGPPDQVPYVDRTDLLWELDALSEVKPQ
jgi:uncharacterized protein with NRDE domain